MAASSADDKVEVDVAAELASYPLVLMENLGPGPRRTSFPEHVLEEHLLHLRGNLKEDGRLRIRCPYLSRGGQWKFHVRTCRFTYNETVREDKLMEDAGPLTAIRCNLFQGINAAFDEVVEGPIGVDYITGEAGTTKVKIGLSNTKWHAINERCPNLEISFSHFPWEVPVTKDISVFVTVCLKKVRY
jgi:hypothetical protein